MNLSKFPIELYGSGPHSYIPSVSEGTRIKREEYVQKWNQCLRLNQFRPVVMFRELCFAAPLLNGSWKESLMFHYLDRGTVHL